MSHNLHVLMITTEWPDSDSLNAVPFIVRQVEFLRQAGLHIDVFHFRGSKNPWNYFIAWLRVRRLLSNSQFDLIHAQWGQSTLVALPKKSPVVVTFRGTDLEGIVGKSGRFTIQGRVLRLISILTARLADEVIVVSERLARRLPDRPYNVIPSGLDLKLFRPMNREEARKKLNLSEEKCLVLFAASPANPIKRFQLAQKAVSLLSCKFDIDLVVTEDVINVLIPVYMSACDVLLLTSVHEGSPNVVKEALACNLPVVSVDVGDVKERIGAVEGCILCSDDKPETLAEGLAEVLSNRRRVEGRKAIRDLDETLLTQRVISVYRDALSKKPV